MSPVCVGGSSGLLGGLRLAEGDNRACRIGANSPVITLSNLVISAASFSIKA